MTHIADINLILMYILIPVEYQMVTTFSEQVVNYVKKLHWQYPEQQHYTQSAMTPQLIFHKIFLFFLPL